MGSSGKRQHMQGKVAKYFKLGNIEFPLPYQIFLSPLCFHPSLSLPPILVSLSPSLLLILPSFFFLPSFPCPFLYLFASALSLSSSPSPFLLPYNPYPSPTFPLTPTRLLTPSLPLLLFCILCLDYMEYFRINLNWYL